LHDGVAGSSEAGPEYANGPSCKFDGPQIAAPPSLRSTIFGPLCRQFPALRFRENLGENNGMIHDPITRCIYQCCSATCRLPQDLCRRVVRFQFVAVASLEFRETVCTMIEPSSQ
jgi:hypothetical protein